jgi:phosphomannomutase
MKPHSFDPSILREYDIRGVVGRTLTPADGAAAGRAFGTIVRRMGGRTACLGYDGRTHSPEFEAAVCAGLVDAGLEVWRVGLGPSPMLYFSVYHLAADAGMMVTGSHNPPDQNGFKMMLGPTIAGGGAFFGQDIQRLGALAAAGDFASGAGVSEDRPVHEDYVAALAAEAGPGGKALAVAWDCGNGATGEIVRRLVARLPGRHAVLFGEIDGRFPHHHPDPTVARNLVDLQRAVQREGCDFGVAFDGDGDRIGAVDARGRILWADQLMVLFARDLLARQPGSTVIADVKASQVLFDEIARAGGKPIMYKTGHSLIKAKMKETGAPLAGEMSGHIFFADRNKGYDDGIFAAVRLLRILGTSPYTLAEFLDRLPKVVNTPELRFACPAERKAPVIEEVRGRLAAGGAEIDATDGIRVREADGWWLLRASNTQDVLVARCEAADEAGLARLKSRLAAELAQAGLALPDDAGAH